jgi:hypothetical protein
MSGRSRNFVFAYAFLVALPLLGLAGVLKTGRHLSAPRAIDGLWSLQLDAGSSEAGCSGLLGSIQDKVISISQSGKTFVLSVPGDTKIAATGTLEGDTLHAAITSSEPPRQSSCPGQPQLSLSAKVEKDANSSILIGQLSDVNCPSCAAVPFKASRREDAPPKAAR